MGPLGQKLLRELRAVRGRGAVDLQAVRESRRFDEELRARRRELEEHLSSSHAAWMELFAILSKLGQALLGSRSLRKMAERIEAAEDEYMPGGPPMSPILDSVFMSWLSMDLGAGPGRETLFGLIADLGPTLGLPEPVCDAARTMSKSAFAVYRVNELGPQRVELVELASGHRCEVQLPTDLESRAPLWFVRVLPPLVPGTSDWVVWSTPYALLDPTAERDWLAYFERLAPQPSERAQRVAQHFKAPPRPMFWLDYIMDGYLGCTKTGAIVLSGIPDKPETLPHSESYDPAAQAAASGESPLARVRSRLLAIAHQRGDDSAAREGVREILGAPEEPLNEQIDQTMSAAYAMLGQLDAEGRTAVDVLALRAQSLPEDERAVLEQLQAGWFSAFEVLHVRVDEGLEVRDVLRRRRHWIEERSGTRQIALGDLLVGWTLVDGDRVMLEGGTLRVPQAIAERFAEHLKTLRDSFAKRARGLDWKKRAGVLAQWVVPVVDALVTRQAPPRIVNRAGHDVVMAEAVYDVHDAARVTAVLAERFEEGEHEHGRFLHIVDRSLVAELRLRGQRLSLRCHSREDLAALRKEIESALGRAIVHRADVIQDPSSSALDAPEDDNVETEPETALPPEIQKAVHAFVLEHMRGWLDEPVPALGNKTPRQAVRTARGRDAVTHSLVRQQDLLDSNPQTAGVDLGEIWSALGLEPPPR